MSDGLSDILEVEYGKAKEKKNTVDLSSLLEMVERVYDTIGSEVIGEAKEERSMEELYKFLPQFEFSEMIGRPDDADIANKGEVRSTFTTLMSGIAPGEGLQEKIDSVNEFVSSTAPEVESAAEVLRNLTFLRLLSVVVQDFTDAGAGFIFEAFLAGLLGGAQVSGRGGEETKGSLPIHDYNDNEGKPVSLKLLNPKTPIGGSMYNITQFLANHPLGIAYGIRYVVGIKYDDEKLGFYEFTIDRNNYFDWLGEYIDLDEINVSAPQPVTEAEDPRVEKLRQHADKFKETIISLMPMMGHSVENARNRLSPIEDAAEFTGNRGLGSLRHSKFGGTNLDLMSDEAGRTAFEKFLSVAGISAPENAQISPESDLNLVRKARYDLLKAAMIKLSPDNPLSIRSMRQLYNIEHAEEAGIEVGDKVKVLNQLAQTNPEAWGETILANAKRGGGGVFPNSQFELKQAQALSRPETINFGNLVIGKSQVLQVMNSYGEILREQIMPIYEQLYEVTFQINKFFVEGTLDAAPKASEHGNALAAETNTLAKSVN
jgi:hypothetical protein